MNDEKEKPSGQEMINNVQSCCDGGSCCPSGTAPVGRKWKTLIFILVIITAGVLTARPFIQNSDVDSDQNQMAFASIPADNSSNASASAVDAANPGSPTESKTAMEALPEVTDTESKDKNAEFVLSQWQTELDSLASLNKVAVDTNAVFILLTAKNQQDNPLITKQIDAATQKIKSSGIKVSVFRLTESAPEYEQLSKQVSIPCVLAMVKGAGMSAVSKDITESKLIQAFVAASRTSSCGSSGCGPSGCN